MCASVQREREHEMYCPGRERRAWVVIALYVPGLVVDALLALSLLPVANQLRRAARATTGQL